MIAPLDPVAWLDHDWPGVGVLQSYPPVPAETNRGGNRLHDQLWGMETRSPVTPYFCAWRDTARHTAQDRKLGWPTRLLIVAGLGTEPWTPPADLVEEATQQQWRDGGELSLGWVWSDENEGYVLERLGLEIRRGGSAERFRSFHNRDDIAGLDIVARQPERPCSLKDSIGFHVSGHLRARYNAGEALKGAPVRFTAMGTAAGLPSWMMY